MGQAPTGFEQPHCFPSVLIPAQVVSPAGCPDVALKLQKHKSPVFGAANACRGDTSVLVVPPEVQLRNGRVQ
jgi:hypothetical protein